LSIFFYGFSSGLPFLLTLSTLTIWLKESGLNNTTVGLFVIVTIPYTLKFLWGPMVDRVSLPILSRFLGQRRSWALVAQGSLIFMLLGLGSSNPTQDIFGTALWAFGVALCSAIQDIVIEAYRIEVIDENQQGSAASSSYLGYRLGMMTSGAGALFLAEIYSWQTAYELMAALMVVGMVTTLLSPSPKADSVKSHHKKSLKGVKGNTEASKLLQEARTDDNFITSYLKWVRATYDPPLRSLLNTIDWRVVLAFILFYKVGDTTLNVMTTPFLVELGYSKVEIANVAKVFGISAMIFGGFLGGLILNHVGILSCLMLCAILQILSSLMFVIQALIGYNIDVLMITVGIENLTCGLGASAFIAYLSSLCSRPHTATHFALLSSFGSMARIVLSAGAGYLADILPWSLFFTFTAVACLPALFLLLHASHHFPTLSFLRPVQES
jgi:PAT family beta-lactamase induction signal transducer AmpG